MRVAPDNLQLFRDREIHAMVFPVVDIEVVPVQWFLVAEVIAGYTQDDQA